jgi:hypothetical protein
VAFGVVLLGALVTVRSHTAIGDQLRPAVRPRRVGALIKPANWLFLQAPSNYSRGWAGGRILYQVDRKSVRLKIRRFSHVVNLLGQHASRPAISWSAVCKHSSRPQILPPANELLPEFDNPLGSVPAQEPIEPFERARTKFGHQPGIFSEVVRRGWRRHHSAGMIGERRMALVPLRRHLRASRVADELEPAAPGTL